ncbi:MAG TPA: TetR/AcrR family transcriptional regulator [Myxococcota bacterium]|jgi:AcrR family transcriptional regulator
METPAVPKEGLARASRKEATQARILRAAMELFATRGFEGTSISAIASRAGVSRGAVFWHFGSKAALFKEACVRFFIPFWREFEKSLDGPPRERVFELLEAYEKFVASNRETIRAFVRWVLESQTMRESLQGELFALHGLFIRKVSGAIGMLTATPEQAEEISLGLVSHLAGNLLFELLDPDEKLNERRRESLRAVAERLLPEGPASARGRRPRP